MEAWSSRKHFLRLAAFPQNEVRHGGFPSRWWLVKDPIRDSKFLSTIRSPWVFTKSPTRQSWVFVLDSAVTSAVVDPLM